MDEQERKMLEEVVELSRDNNAMVHKLVNAQRMAIVWRWVYWAIIIGATWVAYNALQPYIAQIMKMYDSANQVMNSLPK